MKSLPPILILAAVFSASLVAADADRQFTTIEQSWGGFDPRALPIEAETVKETISDGLVLRTVRYTSETVGGFKVCVMAYYGFPEGKTKLPAVMHVHGGG